MSLWLTAQARMQDEPKAGNIIIRPGSQNVKLSSWKYMNLNCLGPKGRGPDIKGGPYLAPRMSPFRNGNM